MQHSLSLPSSTPPSWLCPVSLPVVAHPPSLFLSCSFPAVPASLVTVWAQSPLAAQLWTQHGWSSATVVEQSVEAVLLPFLLILPALSQARYGFGRGARGAGSLVPRWGCKCALAMQWGLWLLCSQLCAVGLMQVPVWCKSILCKCRSGWIFFLPPELHLSGEIRLKQNFILHSGQYVLKTTVLINRRTKLFYYWILNKAYIKKKTNTTFQSTDISQLWFESDSPFDYIDDFIQVFGTGLHLLLLKKSIACRSPNSGSLWTRISKLECWLRDRK